MSEMHTPKGTKVELGDITGYDKVTLMECRTDVGVRYTITTLVDGGYYEHHKTEVYPFQNPNCADLALWDAEMWIYECNSKAEIWVRNVGQSAEYRLV